MNGRLFFWAALKGAWRDLYKVTHGAVPMANYGLERQRPNAAQLEL
jgi:hypothetical protein